jgi:hypothetical protein
MPRPHPSPDSEQYIDPARLDIARQTALAEPESLKFLESVATAAGVDNERALNATGVVLCTLLLGTPSDTLSILEERLPSGVVSILKRCKDIRGNSLSITGPTSLVEAVAQRMLIPSEEAGVYTQAVLEITARSFEGGIRGMLEGFKP